MDNLYSNAILNLINAYSQRISNYSLVINKLNSFNEGVFHPENENKNDIIEKLIGIVSNNIEVLNILQELFTKENSIFTINANIVREIKDGLKSIIERKESTKERLELTTERLKSTIERKELTTKRLESSKERIDTSNEQYKTSEERIESTNEGKELTIRGLESTIDFLREIEEILSESLYLPLIKSEESTEVHEESPRSAMTPEEVQQKIIQLRGILRKPFLEYFKDKYKLDKIPVRLAIIMEEFYKKPAVTQRHIRSIARSTWVTVGRAFSELRKQGWIKLESSKKNQKYILTPSGKAFVEKVVNGL